VIVSSWSVVETLSERVGVGREVDWKGFEEDADAVEPMKLSNVCLKGILMRVGSDPVRMYSR
jgi:hypothetical protein